MNKEKCYCISFIANDQMKEHYTDCCVTSSYYPNHNTKTFLIEEFSCFVEEVETVITLIFFRKQET